METKGLEDFVKYLKNRTYDLAVRAKLNVSVSIYFTTSGERKVFVKNKDRKILTVLPIQVFEMQPDKINVELDFNGKVENHVFDMKYLARNENYSDFNDNNRGTNETPDNNRGINENSRENNEHYRDYPKVNEMSGFGNVSSQSIESIVNKRLAEERRERLVNDQKTTIDEKNEIITKKTKELETLVSTLESKKVEIEDLQKKIETKRSLKYYASLTGDILQSFGISKEVVATPLAGILVGNNKDNLKAIEQNTEADESGIIDDEIPHEQLSDIQSKRNEMIALIGEYLKGVDNSTLTNIFSIFSEIENNPQNAISILEYLKQNK